MNMGHCNFCDRDYCNTHRMPEIHSPSGCGVAVKESAKASYRKESASVIDLSKRDNVGELLKKGGGNLVRAAKIDKQEAGKRLKEKIKAEEIKRKKK